MYVMVQAEESKIEETLKVLQNEVDVAESDLTRLIINLVLVSSLYFWLILISFTSQKLPRDLG